ncbi:hypothetical protein T12_7284 [Trichinella patagoniensis]|uniref:Uncharacterized protein n=1 Tax=Trichinella patagoniensis TaxID=990121 RepID=A0A0V0ZKK6_9BILA|nr:hypothetical protein T12_7284 [Trichinella patagoniensis]
MAKKARTICPQERATCSCRPCGKHDDHSWMDQLRPLGPTKRTKKKGRRAQLRKCGPVCENLERANRLACMLDAGKFNSKNEESSSPSRRRRRNYTRSQPSHCTLNAANVLINVNKTDNSKSSGKEMFDELNSKIEKAMKQHNTDAYGTDKASTKVANSRKA